MKKGIEKLLEALDIDPEVIEEDLFGSNLVSYYHDWTDGILYDLMYVHEVSDDPEELKAAELEYDEAMRHLKVEVMAYLAGERESRWTSDWEEAI